MIQVQAFTFNAFQENTYLVFDENGYCVVIDPGCYEEAERLELASFVEDHALKVVALLNTHCHVDHVLGNAFIKGKYKVDLLIHPLEETVLRAAPVIAPNYGLFKYQHIQADGFFEENQTLKFGEIAMKVIFVPGHSPGHVAFLLETEKILLGGDVLFYNSIGRTDLPGGDFQTLINSIHRKLFTLDDRVVVYPGHGPETTIGFEKKTNPFCALTDV